MKKKYVFFFFLPILIFLDTACSKPEDISGKLDGIWTTQWEDILKGNIDDIKVEEAIEFISRNSSGNSGDFRQFFEGEVKFDDWENESWVSYNVFVSGTWKVKKNDIISLNYDLNEMVVNIGKSNVEADYTDAGISLLFGDWSGALSSALKASDTSKINQKIEKEIRSQVTIFFKDMFHDIKKAGEAMTDVVIDGNMMTCDVNHGFFGREQVYDRIKENISNNINKKVKESNIIFSKSRKDKGLEGNVEIEKSEEEKYKSEPSYDRDSKITKTVNEKQKNSEEIDDKFEEIKEQEIVKEVEPEKPIQEEIFVAVEKPAEFPGGQAALMKWINNNVRYPEAAQQNDIQGRVVVKFVIEKDGSISHAEIARSIDKDLDREALRVVNKMPKWEPGKNNGVAVRSYFNLPVTFRLTPIE